MTLFRRKKPTTHIVKRPEAPKTPLHRAVTDSAHGNTRGWEIRRDEFRTFDSPPGRF